MAGPWRNALLEAEQRTTRSLATYRWPLNAALGYAAGLGLPAIPEASRVGTLEALRSAFFTSSLQAGLSVLAIVTAIFYAALGPVLQHRASQRTLDRALLSGFREYMDPLFLDGDGGLEGFAWGKGQTLLACPRPETGWQSSEITFRVNRAPYDFDRLEAAEISALHDRDLRSEYVDYRRGLFAEQYASDGEKWALGLRPSSFSDDIAIRLEVVPSSWSQCQFFWRRVVSSESLPALYAAAMTPRPLPYPSSLCLHLIVYSSEGMVLLTRSHGAKANDYPLSWACSIGEQLASEDIDNLSQDCAQNWVHRALDEELSVAPSEAEGIRFLALSFEGDIANFAMIGVVHLRLSQHDVMARLRTTNRLDNEFSAIEFISVDQIPGELVAPSREFHPSSGLRLMYAYLHVRGQFALRRELAKELRTRL